MRAFKHIVVIILYCSFVAGIAMGLSEKGLSLLFWASCVVIVLDGICSICQQHWSHIDDIWRKVHNSFVNNIWRPHCGVIIVSVTLLSFLELFLFVSRIDWFSHEVVIYVIDLLGYHSLLTSILGTLMGLIITFVVLRPKVRIKRVGVTHRMLELTDNSCYVVSTTSDMWDGEQYIVMSPNKHINTSAVLTIVFNNECFFDLHHIYVKAGFCRTFHGDIAVKEIPLNYGEITILRNKCWPKQDHTYAIFSRNSFEWDDKYEYLRIRIQVTHAFSNFSRTKELKVYPKDLVYGEYKNCDIVADGN